MGVIMMAGRAYRPRDRLETILEMCLLVVQTLYKPHPAK
jgi:hypothetical protein